MQTAAPLGSAAVSMPWPHSPKWLLDSDLSERGRRAGHFYLMPPYSCFQLFFFFFCLDVEPFKKNSNRFLYRVLVK